jgi:hemolysin activation/secretion protein
VCPGKRKHSNRLRGSREGAFSLNYVFLLSVAALALHPTHALSQVAPSQLTPQTLRPAAPSAAADLPPPAHVPLQAPVGSDGLSFVAERVVIEGAFPEFEPETRALVAAIEKHRVTVGQIYEFANSLEQAYARAGYVLVRVTVPPQKLINDGPVRIVIVDGFIESVQVDNVPDRVRSVVVARMSSLIGRRHLKLEEIERRLLITGDAPGLRLKSTLARGKTPGSALLALEGTHRLVTATTSIDNRLPSSLGTWSYGTSVALNSAFGLGEQFYASAQWGGDPARIADSSSPLRVLGAGAVLPLGNDGWILNPEYTNSRSQPVPVGGGLVNIGQFERYALRTSFPLIRSRATTLSLNAAYEYINQSVALPLFSTDLNRDRYSVLRGGAAYEAGLPWWGVTLQTAAAFSQGLGGRDGADALASGIPLSRLGAGPIFSKATIDARVIQPLPNEFRLDFIGRAQTSFGNPLLVSEQFSLDGPQAVSAYPSGTLNVDEGGTLRVELSRSFALLANSTPMVLSPYGFGSFGAGRLIEPTLVELAVVRSGAVGVGVRSNLDIPGGYQGLSLGLEVARQFANLPNLPHSWRGQVVMGLRF